MGTFLGQTSDWFQSLVRDEKPVWPEATGLANIIPDSVSALTAEQFVELFGRKPFEAADANRQLETSVLPHPPKELLAQEHQSRKDFLTAFNICAGIEAVLLQHKSQDVEVGPLSAVLKLSLPPLWKAFLAFSRVRLQLRRAVLSS